MRQTTRIDATNEELNYEKTGLLAAISRDTYACDLSDADRRSMRRRVATIQQLLQSRYSVA